MPISLYRGELIGWYARCLEKYSSEAGVIETWSRKALEKRIKKIEKEVERLQAAGVGSIEPLIIVDGQWKVYLNPAARLQRGQEQGHCLGAHTGGPGQEYLAVSNGQWDYGFTMGATNVPSADQTYGPDDCPNPYPKWDEAWEIANRYREQGIYAPATEEEERLRYQQEQLEHFRKLEFIRLRVDGKVTPGVEFDQVRQAEEKVWQLHQVGEFSELLDIARRWRLKCQIVYYRPGCPPACWVTWTGWGEPPEAPEGLEWVRR